MQRGEQGLGKLRDHGLEAEDQYQDPRGKRSVKVDEQVAEPTITARMMSEDGDAAKRHAGGPKRRR
jgi:hypothetical protein